MAVTVGEEGGNSTPLSVAYDMGTSMRYKAGAMNTSCLCRCIYFVLPHAWD